MLHRNMFYLLTFIQVDRHPKYSLSMKTSLYNEMLYITKVTIHHSPYCDTLYLELQWRRSSIPRGSCRYVDDLASTSS